MSVETPTGVIKIPDLTVLKPGDVAVLRFERGALNTELAMALRERLDAFYPHLVVLVVDGADEVVLKRPWWRKVRKP